MKPARINNRAEMQKADLEFQMLLRANANRRPEIDFAALAQLAPRAQVAELMSLEYSKQEIAVALGYKDATSVNGVIQRIRADLGPQAV